VTLSPEGFSTTPGTEQAGKTTRAFRPGPIPAGQWAVELGVAAVASEQEGDSDGTVEWRVEIDWSSDPQHANEPYRATPYNETPVKTQPGWYAGDMHVHAEHSAYRDATMAETFDYAFGSLEDGKAGLDFITLSDYVSGSAWGEIGKHQAAYPNNLIVRSAEVITYRGHINNHNSATVVDYRAGPIYQRNAGDGALTPLRGPQPASVIFDQIRAAGGYTQVNHPTIFPNEVPGFDFLCRGCPWSYNEAETRYEKVDGIEIATGPAGLKVQPEPGPNPFTATAIQFWEDALAQGHKIAAVGSSDSHNAGRTPSEGGLGITQAPIGQATTVVYAPELSEDGIKQGIEAGHTYVKIRGNDAPDLRFEALAPGASGPPAIMGDTVPGDSANFTARVLGGAPNLVDGAYQLLVVKDGSAPVLSVPVPDDDFEVSFPSVGTGRYRLQLQRGQTIEAVSSPIYLEPAQEGTPGGGSGGGGSAGGSGGGSSPGAGSGRLGATSAFTRPIAVGFGSHSPTAVRRGAFKIRCRARGTGRRVCEVEVLAAGAGAAQKPRRIGFGRAVVRRRSAVVRVRLNRTGRRLLRRRPRGLRVTLGLRVRGPGAQLGTAKRRAKLRRHGRR
jgi:hypothetical protein